MIRAQHTTSSPMQAEFKDLGTTPLPACRARNGSSSSSRRGLAVELSTASSGERRARPAEEDPAERPACGIHARRRKPGGRGHWCAKRRTPAPGAVGRSWARRSSPLIVAATQADDLLEPDRPQAPRSPGRRPARGGRRLASSPRRGREAREADLLGRSAAREPARARRAGGGGRRASWTSRSRNEAIRLASGAGRRSDGRVGRGSRAGHEDAAILSSFKLERTAAPRPDHTAPAASTSSRSCDTVARSTAGGSSRRARRRAPSGR